MICMQRLIYAEDPSDQYSEINPVYVGDQFDGGVAQLSFLSVVVAWQS
jgi:hypothetical protein